MNRNFSLIQTNWAQHNKELSQVRRDVFIIEQKVPEALEWDEFDDTAIHILVLNEKQKPIATGRLKTNGQIGRMAVIKNYRKQGIGSAILKALINYASQQHYPKLYLHAQLSAVGFYQQFNFKEYGEQFMDTGIAHQSMQLTNKDN